MSHSIPDMCDEFADRIQVLEPLFKDFGARRRFSGEIVTVKCFEDNTVVKQSKKLFDEWGAVKKLSKDTKKEISGLVDNESKKNTAAVSCLPSIIQSLGVCHPITAITISALNVEPLVKRRPEISASN